MILRKKYFNFKTLSTTLLFSMIVLLPYILEDWGYESLPGIHPHSLAISFIPSFAVLFLTIFMQSKKIKKNTLKMFLGLFFFFTALYLIGIPLSKLSSDTEAYPFFVGLFPIIALFFILLLTLMSYIVSKIVTKNKE